MAGELKNRPKDRWYKFQIIVQAVIAFVGMLFTIVFGVMEYKNQRTTLKLTSSNFEPAKAQVKV